MLDSESSLLSCLLIFALSTTVLGIVLLIWALLVVVTVENHSMSPTLKHGDRVLVLRYWPDRWLSRGQVVLIWPWLHSSRNARAWGQLKIVPYIKRIVALPGDTIVTSIADLSDLYHAEQIVAHDDNGQRVWHIPPDHLFVRGDNRPGGDDSLTWGPIPFRSVLGVVIVKLPIKRASRTTPTPMPTPASSSAWIDQPDAGVELYKRNINDGEHK